MVDATNLSRIVVSESVNTVSVICENWDNSRNIYAKRNLCSTMLITRVCAKDAKKDSGSQFQKTRKVPENYYSDIIVKREKERKTLHVIE